MGEYPELNIGELLRDKEVTTISTEEALKDVEPFMNHLLENGKEFMKEESKSTIEVSLFDCEVVDDERPNGNTST